MTKSSGQEISLYQPHLEGRALFEAAAHLGQIHGESAYAQCMYCSDIEQQELHFQFGYASLYDFTAALWDWSRRKTNEMLEIATLIHEFPKLKNAFRKGRLSWTKARLLLRSLATIAGKEERKAAEEKWLQEIHKTYKQLQSALAQAIPESPVVQETLRMQMDLPPEVFALWEKAYDHIKKACYAEDGQATPAEIVETMARLVLANSKPETKVVAPAEVTVQQCPDCAQEFLQTKTYGAIGIDKRHSTVSREANRHIPAATYKKVLQEHDHQCAVPGCHHHLFLHAHHIKDYAQGGSHDEENLMILCSRHHRLLHEGKITLELCHGQACFRDSFGDVMGSRKMHFADMRQRIQENPQYPPEIKERLLRVSQAIEDYCQQGIA